MAEGKKLGELNGHWVTWFKFALCGLVPICGFAFSWLGWVSAGMLLNRERLTVIETASRNYVTNEAAMNLRSDIDNRISILRLDMMKQSQDPPAWFRDAMDSRLNAIDESLKQIRLQLKSS